MYMDRESRKNKFVVLICGVAFLIIIILSITGHSEAPTNKLSNASLEEWNEEGGIVFWSGEFAEYVDYRINGLLGEEASVRDTPYHDYANQEVEVNSGVNYYLEAWFKVPDGSEGRGEVRLGYEGPTGNTKESEVIKIERADGWKNLDINVTPTETGTGEVQLYTHRGGKPQPDVSIGAAWFSSQKPPDSWPVLQKAIDEAGERQGKVIEVNEDHNNPIIIPKSRSEVTIAGTNRPVLTIPITVEAGNVTVKGFEFDIEEGETGINVDAASTTILNNEFYGNSGEAIVVSQAYTTIKDSFFGGLETAVTVEGNVSHTDVKTSTFETNGVGILVKSGAGVKNSAAKNKFVDNEFAVKNYSEKRIDAIENYWNDRKGPDHEDNPRDTNGDIILGKLDFEPWYAASSLENLSNEILYDLEVTQDPVEVNQGEAISVDLNRAEDLAGKKFDATEKVRFGVNSFAGIDQPRSSVVDFESGEAEEVKVLKGEDTDIKAESGVKVRVKTSDMRLVDDFFVDLDQVAKTIMAKSSGVATANGTDEVEFSVSVKDVVSNPIKGAKVRVNKSEGLGSLKGLSEGDTTQTDGGGHAIFTAMSSEAGKYAVEFSQNDAGTARATATYHPGPASTLSLNPSPQAVEANTESTAKLTAIVKDAVGNSVSEVTVEFDTQHGSFTNGSKTTTVTTDSSGRATVSLIPANKPNESTVKATANGISTATTIFFSKKNDLDVEASRSEVIRKGKKEGMVEAREEVAVQADVEKKGGEVETEVSVTIAEFENAPRGKKALNTGSGGYLDLHVDHPRALKRATVRFYLDSWPGQPMVKYWDSKTESWQACSNFELSPEEGYIQLIAGPDTDPDLSYFSGGHLAAGGLDTEYVQIRDPGWSLVAPPLKPEEGNKGDYRDPTFVFNTSEVYHWDPVQEDWLTPAGDYELSALEGIWVYKDLTLPDSFKIAGVYSGSVEIELTNPGWHQVGSPLDYGWSDIGVKQGEDSDTKTVVAQAAGPSAPHWMSRFIWDYDSGAESYTAYDARNSSFQLGPGAAYWVKTYEPNVKLVIPHAAPPPVPTETSTQPRGIPMGTQQAKELDLPQPPAPPTSLSIGGFKVWATPNPLTRSDQITFFAAGSQVQSFEVTVYDSSGKRIHASGTNNEHTYIWKPESELSNGLYLYRVTARKDEDKVVTETGKLLVLQ